MSPPPSSAPSPLVQTLPPTVSSELPDPLLKSDRTIAAVACLSNLIPVYGAAFCLLVWFLFRAARPLVARNAWNAFVAHAVVYGLMLTVLCAYGMELGLRHILGINNGLNALAIQSAIINNEVNPLDIHAAMINTETHALGIHSAVIKLLFVTAWLVFPHAALMIMRYGTFKWPWQNVESTDMFSNDRQTPASLTKSVPPSPAKPSPSNPAGVRTPTPGRTSRRNPGSVAAAVWAANAPSATSTEPTEGTPTTDADFAGPSTTEPSARRRTGTPRRTGADPEERD